MIFCACVSDSEPPNTVKSLAKTKTLRPFTVPQPVTTPSPAILRLLHAEVVGAVLDEHVELLERVLVHEQLDALARGQLAALVLRLDAPLCRRRRARWRGARRACRECPSWSARWPVGWSSPLHAARPTSPPARRRELQWRSSLAGRAHGVTAPYSAASGHAAVSSRSPPCVKAQTVKRTDPCGIDHVPIDRRGRTPAADGLRRLPRPPCRSSGPPCRRSST